MNLKDMMKKINYWIIRKIFARRFKYFDYSFQKADKYLENLLPVKRIRYYKAISEWKSSDAYKIEMQELVQTFYKELSVKTTSEPQFSGYRLVLLFIQRFEQRMEYLAKKYEIEEKVDELQTNLK